MPTPSRSGSTKVRGSTMIWPAILTDPPRGVSSPAISRSRVLLPLPLGPRMPSVSPFSMVKELPLALLLRRAWLTNAVWLVLRKEADPDVVRQAVQVWFRDAYPGWDSTVVQVLGRIFEADFCDCNCGYRPGRSTHTGSSATRTTSTFSANWSARQNERWRLPNRSSKGNSSSKSTRRRPVLCTSETALTSWGADFVDDA